MVKLGVALAEYQILLRKCWNFCSTIDRTFQGSIIKKIGSTYNTKKLTNTIPNSCIT